MSQKYRRWKKEDLAPIVKASSSWLQVVRHFDLRGGASGEYLREKCDQFEIDYSHFTGQAHLKGKKPSNFRTAEQVLVLRDDAGKERGQRLMEALLEIGRDYICAGCELTEWRGKTLKLQVHHKNKIGYDHRPENLEFLCPNCHVQEHN